MDSITTIKDTRVRIKVSDFLIDLLVTHKSHLNEVPKNIRKILESRSINITSNIKILEDNIQTGTSKINHDLVKEMLNEDIVKTKYSKRKCTDNCNNVKPTKELFLYLSDLHWLSNFLASLRKIQVTDVYLNEVLETCQLDLPKNEIIKRNAELEARCKKLREEQQNLEYRRITKNVDAVLKHYPEDTVAYQIKAINSQIIAVLQFIFSVAAGFAFGFLGVNLIIGNMEFGLRLLLGIMCALIIALAEIYFLAKKLNEYDNTMDTINKAVNKTLPSNKKVHTD